MVLEVVDGVLVDVLEVVERVLVVLEVVSKVLVDVLMVLELVDGVLVVEGSVLVVLEVVDGVLVVEESVLVTVVIPKVQLAFSGLSHRFSCVFQCICEPQVLRVITPLLQA